MGAPDPIEYVTVGDLYGQVREAFETLDERQLFIGPRMAQDTDDWSANLRLGNVGDRAAAVEATNDIIEEGEAPRRNFQRSTGRRSFGFAKPWKTKPSNSRILARLGRWSATL